MLIFDTETTGLVENMSTRSEKQPEVIEFCGIIINPRTGTVIEELDRLIKPTQPISEEITGMNGITNEMVRHVPSFGLTAPSIRDLIERSDCVVAHNAAFDRDMIDLEFARLKLTPVAWPRIICTVEATLHLTGYRQSLSSLYLLLFKKKFEGAHRARADVEALARIVVELRKRGEI